MKFMEIGEATWVYPSKAWIMNKLYVVDEARHKEAGEEMYG
jgi:hypothetical protein